MDVLLKLSRRQGETLDFILAEVAAGRAVPGQAKVRERFGLSSFGAGGYRLSALVKAGALEHAAKGEYVLTDAGRSWVAPATPTKPWPMPIPAESVRWPAPGVTIDMVGRLLGAACLLLERSWDALPEGHTVLRGQILTVLGRHGCTRCGYDCTEKPCPTYN